MGTPYGKSWIMELGNKPDEIFEYNVPMPYSNCSLGWTTASFTQLNITPPSPPSMWLISWLMLNIFGGVFYLLLFFYSFWASIFDTLRTMYGLSVGEGLWHMNLILLWTSLLAPFWSIFVSFSKKIFKNPSDTLVLVCDPSLLNSRFCRCLS